MRIIQFVGIFAFCVTTGASQETPVARSYAFRTLSGFYLTAENGGGANINTDRREMGPWEKFVLVPKGPGIFAIKADNGAYISETLAANSERRNRPNVASKTTLSVMQAEVNSSTGFKLVLVNPEGPVVAILTPAGKYVTAENGGGLKARGGRPISTDRTEIGEWEQFVLVDAGK